MNDDRLRAGLLGYGFAGRIFHAPFLAAAGFEVAAIATSAPERTAQARLDFPVAEIVARPAELIGREDLDLIVVATPNATHAELAVAALEAGHDVVVDKPFAPSVGEALHVIETAAETGGVLSVFQNRRFDADFRTVQSVLADGELGTVHRFESRYERWRPQLSGGWRESGDAAQAGGLLYDLGAHLIDQVIALFGLPSGVYAEIAGRRPGVAVDDEDFLALDYDGMSAHLWISALAADAGPRFRILGSQGAFVKSGMDPQEDALLAGARPPAPDWGAEQPSQYGRIGVEGNWRQVVSLPGNYTEFYRRFALAMNGEEPVPVDPADAVAGLRVIDAARRSAQSGAREPIEA